MKKLTLLLLISYSFICQLKAQDLSEQFKGVLLKDDSTKLRSLIAADDINKCYSGGYSILSHTVRFNAEKCFRLVLMMGADVNKICGNYVPPIMHAAKYGRVDMLKVLVKKGADPNYTYQGNEDGLKGITPIKYAQIFEYPVIVSYLDSLNKTKH